MHGNVFTVDPGPMGKNDIDEVVINRIEQKIANFDFENDIFTDSNIYEAVSILNPNVFYEVSLDF